MCEPYTIDRVTWGDIESDISCRYCNNTNCENWNNYNKTKGGNYDTNNFKGRCEN